MVVVLVDVGLPAVAGDAVGISPAADRPPAQELEFRPPAAGARPVLGDVVPWAAVSAPAAEFEVVLDRWNASFFVVGVPGDPETLCRAVVRHRLAPLAGPPASVVQIRIRGVVGDPASFHHVELIIVPHSAGCTVNTFIVRGLLESDHAHAAIKQ